MEQELFWYYKIPFNVQSVKQTHAPAKLHIVGVIDSSGSMSSWWKWIAQFWNTTIPKDNLYTITFSNDPAVVASNTLSEKIQHHGGGGTAIPNAFVLLDKHLLEVPPDQTITVIFISDGQDNQIDTLDERM